MRTANKLEDHLFDDANGYMPANDSPAVVWRLGMEAVTTLRAYHWLLKEMIALVPPPANFYPPSPLETAKRLIKEQSK